jgi:hypothetical protein
MLNHREVAQLIHEQVAMPMFRAFPGNAAPFHKVHRLVLYLQVDRYTSHPDFLPGVRAGLLHFCSTMTPGRVLEPVEVVDLVHDRLSLRDDNNPDPFQIGFACGWVVTMMVSGMMPLFPPPSNEPLKRVRRRCVIQQEG